METRHEKNAQRKLRVKGRKNAVAKALRAEPLRPITTCGLHTLQHALGLSLDLCLLPSEGTKEGNFESNKMDKGASSRAGLSNIPDVAVTSSATETISEPITPTHGDFSSQQVEIRDVIFIAIDFEYSHHSPKTGRIRLREVGISMLDTRGLCHQSGSLKDVISTQHYRTVADTKKFLFGKSVDISQDDLVLILKRLLYLDDGSPKPNRDLILVGHGFGFEIKVLRGLGLDLNLASSVVEIFDTEFLGYEVFGKNFNSSLSKVVEATGISGGFFHNAGNDANFSLRAMLLLACHGYDTSKADIILKSRLEMYKKIAQF